MVGRMFRQSRLLFPVEFAWQVFFAVRKNIELSRAYAVAFDARNLQRRPNIQRGDGMFQQLRGNAGSDQRAKEHVAANAGKTIEIGYAHKSLSLVVRRRSLAIEFARVSSRLACQGAFANDLRPKTRH